MKHITFPCWVLDLSLIFILVHSTVSVRWTGVHTVYSRSPASGQTFQDKWDIPNKTTDLNEAIQNDAIDTVIIGLPNQRHEEAVLAAADAGKAILLMKQFILYQ